MSAPPDLEDFTEVFALRRKAKVQGTAKANDASPNVANPAVSIPAGETVIPAAGEIAIPSGGIATSLEGDRAKEKEKEKEKEKAKGKSAKPAVQDKSSSGGFAGFKPGFLSQPAKKKNGKSGNVVKKADVKTEDPIIELVTPKARAASDAPSVTDHLKNLGLNEVPSWMKPSDELLNDVQKDETLMKGVNDARIAKAIDEISKDPQAFYKYQNDKEVVEYFTKMCGLFGANFDRHEAQGKRDG
jgi:hypothetical protein